jgi:hypothetical protein
MGQFDAFIFLLVLDDTSRWLYAEVVAFGAVASDNRVAAASCLDLGIFVGGYLADILGDVHWYVYRFILLWLWNVAMLIISTYLILCIQD